MTKQQTAVLQHLHKVQADTDSNMALVLGYPAPSIRRTLQSLMKSGHHISFAGSTGLYTLAQE